MTKRPALAADPTRWHYRASLASRVTLLTTMAVGLAVAFVAAGAFLTVKMQLQSSLDQSLLERAHAAAKSPALSQITDNTNVQSWALGAGDVRMAFVYQDGRGRMLDTQAPLDAGQPRAQRGDRAQRLEHPDHPRGRRAVPRGRRPHQRRRQRAGHRAVPGLPAGGAGEARRS